jgi:hypothetical protein
MKLAPVLGSRATHGDTLVMRSSRAGGRALRVPVRARWDGERRVFTVTHEGPITPLICIGAAHNHRTRSLPSWRLRQLGAAAPDPAAYGLRSPPLFQPLTVLRGRGRIFPAPARGDPAPLVSTTKFFCLRRGLRLKDGPGSARSNHCRRLAGVGGHPLAIGQDRPSRLGPPGEGRSASRVLHLHPGGQARYPEGGRRREDEPLRKECAFAQIQRDEHQDDDGLGH